MAEFVADHDAVRTITRWNLLPVVGLSWMALHIGIVPTLLLLLVGLIMVFVMGHPSTIFRSYGAGRFILTAPVRSARLTADKSSGPTPVE